MKAIINGARYDTDKAILVGEDCNVGSVGRGDFRWYDAGLYVTPRAKRYFLAGEGGAMTAFATHFAGGMRGSGERIIPMTREDALEWAEQHLDAETVEKHFGEHIEEA